MKNKNLNVFGITSLLLMSGFLLTSTPLHKASAANTTTNKAAWEFIGGGLCASDYTSSGVEATVKGKDSVGNPWDQKAMIPNMPNDQTLRSFFDLNLYDSIEVSISVAMYAEDGSEQAMAVNGTGLMIDVLDADGWDVLTHLKIWVNAGGSLNGDHSYELSLGDWSNTVNPYWIKGNATASSQFNLKFDLVNHLQSYVGGQNGFVSLSGGNQTHKDAVNAALAACNNKIRFAVYGDGGFKTSTKVTLKAINGQSLANNDGTFDDVSAPAFVKGQEVTNESTFLPGYTYNVNDSLVANDIITGSVSYKTSLDNGVTKVDGRSFKITEPGEKTVTLFAVDSVGNESSMAKTITVSAHTASTFATWMNGEHTESCSSKYAEAKTMLLQMSQDEINNFMTGSSEEIVAARERYEAWCRANNDLNPYTGSLVSPSNLSFFKLDTSDVGIVVIIGIVLSLVALLSITSIVLKRKER